MVRDKNHIEIFMEGTRSRSGKALPPKTGLFSMVLEAVERVPRTCDVNFLPVAINYERVIEERSYSLEQSGREKSAENITGLVETQDVLESKYGRIHVRFGRPYSVRDMRMEFPSLTDKNYIRRIAYRLFYEMDRSFHITPTGLAATVLLCGPASGVSEEDFFREVVFYLTFAAATGKKAANILQPCLAMKERDVGDEDNASWRVLKEVMYHAVHLLAADDLIMMSAGGGGVYTVPEGARVRLDYYKNAFYGTMAPHALACRSFLAFARETVDIDDLKLTARFLSRLFKYEFIFNPNLPFEANYFAIMFMLESMGLIEIDNKERIVKIRDRRGIERVGVLVESLLESYYTATAAVSRHPGKGMSEREIIRRAFSLHERLMLERELHRIEARNRAAVTYCMKALRDMGILQKVKRRVYDVSDEYMDGREIEEFAQRIHRFIKIEN
jgi:glycerol-3-phosphate O-acyltransferase